MNFKTALSIISQLPGSRYAVTGSLTIKAWLDLSIGLLRTRGSSENIPLATHLEQLYNQIVINDLDVVIGDDRKHFDGMAMMPAKIGSYTRVNDVSRSCTYLNAKTGDSFDLIYHGGAISFYPFVVGPDDEHEKVETLNIISPWTLQTHYLDVVDELRPGTAKHDQAQLKIEALELIIQVVEDFGLELSKSEPAFGRPRIAHREIVGCQSPCSSPIRCALQPQFDAESDMRDMFGDETPLFSNFDNLGSPISGRIVPRKLFF